MKFFGLIYFNCQKFEEMRLLKPSWVSHEGELTITVHFEDVWISEVLFLSARASRIYNSDLKVSVITQRRYYGRLAVLRIRIRDIVKPEFIRFDGQLVVESCNRP